MKTLFYFVLVFCLATLVSAQERVLDKPEFEAIVNGGYGHKDKWKGEKYRMTVTTSSKRAGLQPTDWSSKTISEYGLSGESRSIYTSVFGGKALPTKESVRIGHWVYTRTGNDTWTRKEYVPSSAAGKEEESSSKVLSSQAEYKYLGQSTLVDRPVHMYLKTERRTIINEKSGETTETESKNTYWIDAKGTLLKSDYTSEYRGKATLQTAITMEWELDPSITITAPEINP